MGWGYGIDSNIKHKKEFQKKIATSNQGEKTQIIEECELEVRY